MTRRSSSPYAATTPCFDSADGVYNFPNSLIQGSDGNFYGSTYAGGDLLCTSGFTEPFVGCGTLFKITPEGTLTTLHGFDATDGAGINGPIQATNGTLYGTTVVGGPPSSSCILSCGTVFSLAVGLNPFVETVPIAGKVGAPVTILGTDLTGANSVRFNGKEAAFTVVSLTEITATVPPDGKTGFVTVHTPSGTLKSNVKFQALP